VTSVLFVFFRPRPDEQSLPSAIGLSHLTVPPSFFLASAVFPSLSRAQVPVFKITTEDRSIKFAVKASVAINGTFDKWDATLTFASADVSTGVLDIKTESIPGAA
jgi:polyisoprenoid-binding protein YceI